jgi:hypothetical protein
VVTGGVRLVVRADDFGMCHAVDEAIRLAFREGIVTTASTMAPCPWFTEAAAFALEDGLPVGVHQTLTCEWAWFRWGPLTDGPSLRGADGTLRRTVEEVAATVGHQDAVAELTAQVGRFGAAGLRPEYLDHQMGSALPGVYAEVGQRTGIPFLYGPSVHLDGVFELTPREAGEKKAWLLELLAGLGPGVHMLVCHPGMPGPELAALTGRDSESWPWAEHWRIADLAVVTDPEVRTAVGDLGIRLCSLAGASD